jgi:hypothetical protein
MSRASKLTLAATSLFAAGTVALVHFQQKFEKDVRLSSGSIDSKRPFLDR